MSDDYDDYCDYDGDAPEFYNSRWPKAKKEHNCCECASPIFKGEQYCYTSYKWDGAMFTHKQHLECEEACRYLRDVLKGNCIGFGELFSMKKRYTELPSKYPPEKVKNFRSIMAKVIWRSKKAKPLKFLVPRVVINQGLIEDRKSGRAQ